MARVYERNGYWWKDYYLPSGKRVRCTTGVPADAVTQKRMQATVNREAYGTDGSGPKQKPILLRDYADKHCRHFYDNRVKKTADKARTTFKRFEAVWPGVTLHGITREKVKDYKAWREPQVSAAKLNDELKKLRRLLTEAERDGLITGGTLVAQGIKASEAETVRDRVLKPEELAALFRTLRGEECRRILPLVMFCLYTARRRGDALKLQWRDVDFDASEIKLRHVKTRGKSKIKVETISMNAETCALLQSLRPPEGNRVFASLPDDDKTHVAIWRLWNRACLDAGLANSADAIDCKCLTRTDDGKPQRRCFKCGGQGVDPDFHLHDLRHVAATALRKAGVDTLGRMAVLGHKRRQQTDDYTNVPDEDKAAAAEALGGAISGMLKSGTPAVH